jgi:hypothetical protein
MSKKKSESPLDALTAAMDGDPRRLSWGVLMVDTTSGLGEASLHWYRTPAQLVRGVAAALGELTDESPTAFVKKVRARLGATPWTARAIRKHLSDNQSWTMVSWVGRYAELASGRSRWARKLRAHFRRDGDAESPADARNAGAAITAEEAEAFTDWLRESGAQRLWFWCGLDES